MEVKDFIIDFWKNVAEQNAQRLETFFNHDAKIKWHCTNECFTVEEFIKINCEYPGNWNAEVERLEEIRETVVTVARVWSDTLSFHVTSFFKIENNLIKLLDEYWGDDSNPPEWRSFLKLGSTIK